MRRTAIIVFGLLEVLQMVVVGIDVGSVSTKAVLMDKGSILKLKFLLGGVRGRQV